MSHAKAYANRRQVLVERQEEPTKIQSMSYIIIAADLTLTYSTEMGIVLSDAKARFIELYLSSCSAVIRRKHCRYAPRWVKTFAGPAKMERSLKCRQSVGKWNRPSILEALAWRASL